MENFDKLFKDFTPAKEPDRLWEKIEASFEDSKSLNLERRISKVKKILFIGIAVVAIGIAAFLLINRAEKKTTVAIDEKESVYITMIIGNVEIVRENKKISAGLNSVLYSKDRVVVGENSEVHLIYKSLGVFKLKENTDIKISRLGANTKFYVRKGKMLTALKRLRKKKQSFRIQTPTAVAGVRGTSFFVNADSTKTEIAVLTGLVEVKSGGKKSMVAKHKNAVIENGNIDINLVDKLIASELKEIATIASVEKYNLKEIKKSIASLELIMRDESGISDINEKIEAKSIDKQRDQTVEEIGTVKKEIIKSIDKIDKKESGYIEHEGF